MRGLLRALVFVMLLPLACCVGVYGCVAVHETALVHATHR
jgi:hypothetical protein